MLLDREDRHAGGDAPENGHARHHGGAADRRERAGFVVARLKIAGLL
jgi:hypothetical protein